MIKIKILRFILNLFGIPLHHIHIYYMMPGCGKTYTINRVGRLKDLAESVALMDTDTIRLRSGRLPLLVYLCAVLRDGWASHIILFTNQWRFAALADRLGADLRAVVIYSNSEFGLAQFEHNLQDRKVRPSRETCFMWINSPAMRRFVSTIDHRVASLRVPILVREVSTCEQMCEARFVVYRDVVALLKNI